MREIVGSAFVQDAVSRVSSYIFSKLEEKLPPGNNIERLEMAHSELELALEKTGELPIIDVSLLLRRKILKRVFEECSDILHRCKLRAQEDDETDQMGMVMNSSYPKRIAHATQSSIAFLFTKKIDVLSCSDVRRFEWLANCAGKFVRDVESGCSFQHHTFCNPLLRKLLNGNSLGYEEVHGNRFHDIYIWPMCLEERGVEAELSYYEDYNFPERNFHLRLTLRLSESTDIVGIAIKCLQHLTSQFKLVVETTAERTMLPDLLDLLDISYSYAPEWWVVSQESYNKLTQVWRPDPICCQSNKHETYAKNITTSELSKKIPEQVIFINLECSLHSSTDEVGRNELTDWSKSLQLIAGFVPHGMLETLLQSNLVKVWASKRDRRDGNIKQDIETVRSKALNCLTQQPELVKYGTIWQYVHGFAFFQLLTPAVQMACWQDLEYRLKAPRVAKRRR